MEVEQARSRELIVDSIGVIGRGIVGSAVVRGWLEHASEIRVHDVDKRKSTHSIYETLKCSWTFLCLPTPFDPSLGTYDLSAIGSVFSHDEFRGNNSRVVLRSTVTPGTTDMLAREYGVPQLLHSCEYLTARAAFSDFQCPAQMPIGYVDSEESQQAAMELEKVYLQRFPGVSAPMLPALVTEMGKIALNTVFATKLSIFNLIYDACQSLDIDYQDVLGLILGDGRIAAAHCFVNSHGHRRGFGNSFRAGCLRKDSAAFGGFLKARGLGLPAELVDAIHEYNDLIANQE